MALNPIRQRRERIKAAITEQGFCTISELASLLSVSEMTVRRDIAVLEETEGLLRSVHGGVSTIPAQQLAGSDYRLRSRSRSVVKEAIALRALDFLPAQGAIAIDAGTTAFEFARALPEERPFKIVTHSVPVLNIFMGREECEITALGGTLQHSSQSFVGASTISAIADIHVRRYFMGASGINARGAFCANDFEAVVKRALISAADEVILLIDSSKLSSAAMVRICSLDAISVVVVDDGIAADWQARLVQSGMQVVVAPVLSTREL